MKIITDLHVHSKYSRATARDLDLENLYEAAQIKGIQLVGTGDFSHPAWFAEIESKLDPAEPGLLRLKEDAAKALDARVSPACRGSVRFVLATEISNIYKKPVGLERITIWFLFRIWRQPGISIVGLKGSAISTPTAARS